MDGRVRGVVSGVALLVLLLAPGSTTAQGAPGPGVYYDAPSEHPAFEAFRTAETALMNVFVGGLVTGVGSWLRGEGFFPAFGWGAVGGALSFSGKYLAGRYPHGGGLVGRQVAEVGHSIALNGSRGQGPLDELWLAFGPARMRVHDRGDAQGPPLRINLSSLAVAAEYAFRSDTRFSPGESLASGALVFEASNGPAGFRDDLEVHGIARGSVVLLSGTGGFDRTSTFGHELVHVIQSDHATRLITAPLEQYLLGRVGLSGPVIGAIEVSNGILLFNRRPFLRFLETEAERLQRR